jgi:hypothetical protein
MVLDGEYDSRWIVPFLASTSPNSVRAGTALLSKSNKAWFFQTEAVVDGWPLIGEPDQVVGPIVPIQRKRTGRFGYRALVLGRTQFLDFGSFSVKDFPSPRGKTTCPFWLLVPVPSFGTKPTQRRPRSGWGSGFLRRTARNLEVKCRHPNPYITIPTPLSPSQPGLTRSLRYAGAFPQRWSMQGADGVPVEEAVEALGAKSCGLGQDPLFINPKFQPGFAG